MAELLRDEGDLNTREIGAALGVSQTTASRYLSQNDSVDDDETAAPDPDGLPVTIDRETGEIALRDDASSAVLCATMPIMSGHPSRHRPDSVRTPVQTSVPIAEAAARLGISVDAVRKRIQRGTLTGQKTDTGWTVVWTEPDIRPDTVQTPVPEPSALVDELRDHVAYLRDQLDREREARSDADRRHAAEIERRDVLMREALDRVPAIGAGHDAPSASPAAPGAAETPAPGSDASPAWWRFWARRG